MLIIGAHTDRAAPKRSPLKCITWRWTMGLSDEIEAAAKKVAYSDWDIRDGNTIPSTDGITLKNGAVRLDAVYLYADMANSSGLVRAFSSTTAAKVIRVYLDSICRVIRSCGGEIRSFDGDRVMAIFIGNTKNSTAASCALKIHYTVAKIARPILESALPSITRKGYTLEHCTGVASGKALIVRGGVRGSNDLVSVGRAPNVAAKLSDIRNGPHYSYITSEVFNMLNEKAKYTSSGTLMWKGPYDRNVGGQQIPVYRSSYYWKP